MPQKRSIGMDFVDKSRAGDLLQELRRQQEKGDLCNVFLRVNDSTIPVHRCVLAASSDYFRTLVNSDFKDSLSGEYTIPGSSGSAVKMVIDFMYTGTIHISWENVEAILTVADFLCMNNIKAYCSAVLRDNLDDDTCLHIKMLVDHFALDELRTEVMYYLSPRFSVLINKSDMLELPFEVVRSLLSEPELNYIRETELLAFVCRWIGHNPGERQKHLEAMMEMVEFSYLAPETLRKHILSNQEVMETLPPPRVKSLQRLTNSPASQRRVDDVIVCRSRTTKTDDVRLLFYYIKEDKWMALDSGPEAGCWNGLESLVADQSCIYFLVSQTEDTCGHMHQPPEVKKLWKLDPQKSINPWVEAPNPANLKGQSRLVPHVRGLFAVDRTGIVEKLDNVANSWANYGEPRFQHNASSTMYFLPIPIDRYIFILRAYSAGYQCEFPQMMYSLDSYDTAKYCWETLSEIEGGDLDLEETERFHGYTVTPYAIFFKNALGFKRAQYDFTSRQWTSIIPSKGAPAFVKEIWGSVSRMDRVYFAGRMTQDSPTFMMYDHSRERFKTVAPPPEYLTGLLCHLAAPRSLRSLLVEV